MVQASSCFLTYKNSGVGLCWSPKPPTALSSVELRVCYVFDIVLGADQEENKRYIDMNPQQSDRPTNWTFGAGSESLALGLCYVLQRLNRILKTLLIISC